MDLHCLRLVRPRVLVRHAQRLSPAPKRAGGLNNHVLVAKQYGRFRRAHINEALRET
jgi:hypothetical protein